MPGKMHDPKAKEPMPTDATCCEPFCSTPDKPVQATERWVEYKDGKPRIEYHFCRAHYVAFIARRIQAAADAADAAADLLRAQYSKWFNRTACSDQATSMASDLLRGLPDLGRCLRQDLALLLQDEADRVAKLANPPRKPLTGEDLLDRSFAPGGRF